MVYCVVSFDGIFLFFLFFIYFTIIVVLLCPGWFWWLMVDG